MDCFHAAQIGNSLILAGLFGVWPFGLLLRYATDNGRVSGLVCLGLLLCLVLCGKYVNQKWAVCPNCGKQFMAPGGHMAKVPDFCPNCGKHLREE